MKKTAKFLALLCAVLMLVTAVTGCTSAPAEEPAASPEATETPAESAGAAASETPAASEAPAESAEPAEETPTLDAIRERGQLILGTESTYPPFEFIVIENGASPVGVGFDVSLAQAIADKLGVELVTSEMAFDSLIPAVQAGTVDIAASITPTEERKQAVDFSDNYYDTTNVFVVRQGRGGQLHLQGEL